MPRAHDHRNYISAPRHRNDLDFHESSQAIFHYRRRRSFFARPPMIAFTVAIAVVSYIAYIRFV